jgi:hypothetical protein
LLIKGIVVVVSAAGIGFSIAQAGAASTAQPAEWSGEYDVRFNAEERELFRQDIEHLQQNFYQADPESRRRWIESVRERRQMLDREEDRASPPLARIKPTRAAGSEAARPSGLRPVLRDRVID